MDQPLFLFLQAAAFLIFFYTIERDTWHGLLIFLSTALFLALSLASFNIETYHVFLNESTSTIIEHTHQVYDPGYAYLNVGMVLLSGSLGIIKAITFRDSRIQEDES
ncbi:hypothetical protein FTO70_03855 [Methanosarcina sp. KYL-1]|uniref:hypothetical protein n=1 Tax=Methanosarcina sp. KYL-1 TaxID=2602068 RepID=UPI00210117AB|nr:hypothetical protein [Methanosarcina sp. KYL-1]MCQ1534838.1 hypothetical protein [Methanosarcina sp. KYL-1]